MFWIILGGLQAYKCFLCPKDSSSQWTQSRSFLLCRQLHFWEQNVLSNILRYPGCLCLTDHFQWTEADVWAKQNNNVSEPSGWWFWYKHKASMLLFRRQPESLFMVFLQKRTPDFAVGHSISFLVFLNVFQAQRRYFGLRWLSAGRDIPNLQSLILTFKQSWV